MELPPKNYMSLEVFQNYGLFRRKQRTVPCVEYIPRTFCAIKSQSVQNFDTKDKILSTKKLILNFEKIKKKVTNDAFTVLEVTHDWIDEL
jgi:hypothetical protein